MGGSKNSQSKAERRIERKQRREAANRQDHREKEKVRKNEIKEEQKGQPRKSKEWKRRDKNGNIILWNAIKISKTSGYIMGGMLAIVIMFAISPIFEDPNYVEPERFTFAECEAIDHADMWCIYDFKFCQEYDDGSKICEYAETDPFVDKPSLGQKWTPEEQDFLPPNQSNDTPTAGFQTDLSDEEWTDILKDFKIGNFILPLAYGSHDYLSNYALHDDPFTDSPSAVDDVLNEFGLLFVEDDLPDDKDELEKLIKQMRLDLDITQEELMEVERSLQDWGREEVDLKNDRFDAENAWEDAEENLSDSKTAYRHAQDMIVRNNDDRIVQEAAFQDYRIMVKEFAVAEKLYITAMEDYKTGYSEHLEEENLQVELEDRLELQLDQLNDARIKLNLIFREYQFINVNLSRTCQTLIKMDLNTNCPTYREMVPLFDNTLPNISGDFVDVGYDIKRLPSPLKHHWKYYEQMTATRVVSVDADSDLFDRGINITIQANDFAVVEDTGKQNKTPSYDSPTLEQTTWNNIFVSERCDSVSVGPDLKVIEAAIMHVLNKCTTDLSEFKTVIKDEPTEIPKEESAQWRYLKWIADLVASLRDDSNTK